MLGRVDCLLRQTNKPQQLSRTHHSMSSCRRSSSRDEARFLEHSEGCPTARTWEPWAIFCDKNKICKLGLVVYERSTVAERVKGARHRRRRRPHSGEPKSTFLSRRILLLDGVQFLFPLVFPRLHGRTAVSIDLTVPRGLDGDVNAQRQRFRKPRHQGWLLCNNNC